VTLEETLQGHGWVATYPSFQAPSGLYYYLATFTHKGVLNHSLHLVDTGWPRKDSEGLKPHKWPKHAQTIIRSGLKHPARRALKFDQTMQQHYRQACAEVFLKSGPKYHSINSLLPA
jgi:hypothetical protein